jgi:two-component system LytT family response regulator
MVRTVIIDDELNNRQMIADMLRQHCPHIELAGEADGVATGLEVIKRLSPDLVLLDIRLRDGEGFDLLDRLETIDFRVIFITAYEEYALKAIKFSALDYLLKPVLPDELKAAIEKAEKQIVRDLAVQLAELSNNLSPSRKKRIVLRTADKLQLIPVGEIIRCEADRSYSVFYLANGQKILVSYPLKEYEDLLTDQGFFRPHKSHLVNISYVDSYVKSEGGHILLTDGTTLPVSLRKKTLLIELFGKL